MLKRIATLVAIPLVFLAAFAGCDKSGSTEEGSKASAESADKETKEAEKKAAAKEESKEEAKEKEEKADKKEKLSKVDVPEDGKEFDPSVKQAQLPAGAWHCNMKGDVHYAAMKKGDGKCPVCNMKLVEYSSGDHGSHEGEDGHQHGDEEHSHE